MAECRDGNMFVSVEGSAGFVTMILRRVEENKLANDHEVRATRSSPQEFQGVEPST